MIFLTYNWRRKCEERVILLRNRGRLLITITATIIIAGLALNWYQSHQRAAALQQQIKQLEAINAELQHKFDITIDKRNQLQLRLDGTIEKLEAKKRRLREIERKNEQLQSDLQAKLQRERRQGSLIARAAEAITPSVAAAPATPSGSVWDRLAMCESTQRWHYNGPSGFDGGLQFLPSTWTGFGGGEYAPYAYQATRAQQIEIAKRVQAVQGWNAWPSCF